MSAYAYNVLYDLVNFYMPRIISILFSRFDLFKLFDVIRTYIGSSFLKRKKRKNRRDWLSDFHVTWQDAGTCKVGGRYLWMFSSEVVRVVRSLPLRVICLIARFQILVFVCWKQVLPSCVKPGHLPEFLVHPDYLSDSLTTHDVDVEGKEHPS